MLSKAGSVMGKHSSDGDNPMIHAGKKKSNDSGEPPLIHAYDSLGSHGSQQMSAI